MAMATNYTHFHPQTFPEMLFYVTMIFSKQAIDTDEELTSQRSILPSFNISIPLQSEGATME